MIKFFYDLETTGLSHLKNGIHQISGCIEVDDEIAESFDFKVRPHHKAIIDPAALRVAGVTEAEILKYPEMREVYKQIIKMLSKYVDRFDRKDKMWLAGYNNRSFDDPFFRAWFEQNLDAFFGSWFWTDSIDVMVLASEYLMPKRAEMSSFKLFRVAMTLGIPVEEEKLHDASYDIYLTREIYRRVTGRDLDLLG